MKHVKHFKLFENLEGFKKDEIETALVNMDIEFFYDDKEDQYICFKNRIKLEIYYIPEDAYSVKYSYKGWKGETKTIGISGLEYTLKEIIGSKPNN